MILDRLENINDYRAQCPALAAVCDLLPGLALKELPDGRAPLDGDRLYANVSHGLTEPWENRLFEAHRQYADVQIVLAGSELMGYAPVARVRETQPYDGERDIAFYDDPHDAASRLTVAEGMFAVFFPQDAHKPCCRCNDGPVHKVVFKILL